MELTLVETKDAIRRAITAAHPDVRRSALIDLLFEHRSVGEDSPVVVAQRMLANTPAKNPRDMMNICAWYMGMVTLSCTKPGEEEHLLEVLQDAALRAFAQLKTRLHGAFRKESMT